uniref:Cytochrome P450 706A3-2 n=1 Tax=Isatis tinctoria TaxID=161756 RepID=A0A8F0FRG7_ISATI|nr:cytochrome P450 706A3-2 [Isatis tinctoria]
MSSTRLKMTITSSLFKILSCMDHVDYVFIVLALSTVLWYIWLYAKSKRRSHPLPPGPWGLPIFGNLPFLKSDLHTYFQGLAKTHGPIFKLWLGSKLTIVVTSSEVAREILRTNDVIFANHDVPAVALINMYGGIDIAWSPYGPRWRMLRKLCVNRILSNAKLDSFAGLRRAETRRTVRYLAEMARAGSQVNLGEQIFLMTLNVITQMLWGATVEEEEREIVGAEFSGLIQEMNDLLLAPNISDFFPALSRFDLQGLMDRLFDRVINQRLGMDKGSEGKGEDFLEVLLKIKDEEEASTNFNMNDVKALLMDMVLGGTDTSIHVIEFAMAELLKNQDIMKRAQQELDEVVGKDKVVEESHIPKLPHILAIMKETLRLHTVVPLLAPHRPSETTVVSGFTIPKDSKVFINAWAIHRNPNVWENPLEFDPNRFLDKSYEFNGNDFNYIPFGSGRRICVGMAMGERVVLYNIATLLHSFDWKLPPGDSMEVKEKFGITLKLKNPLLTTPVLRLSDPNLYH